MVDIAKINSIAVADIGKYNGINAADIGKVMGVTWSHVPTTIGEEYGGGYYFGTIDVSDTTYYLICSSKTSGENSSLQWKTENTTTPDTTSVVDGLSNTNAMITAGAALHPAANFCNNLTIGDYTDWYLPSKDELNVLYTNHTALETAGAGSFEDDYYWSSTERDSSSPWRLYFPNGALNDYAKASSFYVRAIRRFAA